MALFQSALLTAASGSVGGLTFLPTSSGMALRGKPIPANPRTPYQTLVRTLLAYLTTYWADSLKTDRRHEWDAYAFNTLRRNPLGHPIRLSGIAHWVRSQLPRFLAGLRFFDAAPTVYDTGAFTPVSSFTVDSIAQALILAFNPADPWANEAHSGMLVFISPPQNLSVQNYRKHYRFAHVIPGNAFIPPASPVGIPLPFPAAIGQKVFFRVTVSRADGRYTETQRSSETVT